MGHIRTRNYSKMIRHGVIIATVIASLSASTSSADTGRKSMICKGEMGNGYLTTRPQYKVFGDRTFYLTTECSFATSRIIKSGSCDYTFEGGRYEGYLYTDGSFALPHLGPFNIIQPDGYLMFKMSETTNGQVGNEGQRWFRGQCKTH